MLLAAVTAARPKYPQYLSGSFARGASRRSVFYSGGSHVSEQEPQEIAAGFDKVQVLKQDMANGREIRMNRLGFAHGDAKRLAALHTRNFM